MINIKLKQCDENVDDCLAPLKFIRDWFVTGKMLQKLDNALRANDDILFYNTKYNRYTLLYSNIYSFIRSHLLLSKIYSCCRS